VKRDINVTDARARQIVLAARPQSNFLREVGASIADGRIRYREDIVDDLEKAPEAFIGMLEGRNFGKLIVRVAGNADARTDHPTRHT
jgi:NADPH-dependent curcumin reductase CurA